MEDHTFCEALGSLARRAALGKDAPVIAEYLTRRWQNAGLIDSDTARRIVGWEAAHRRPVWFWAVAGMGTLAIALGVLAIIGANWESIPAWVKLSLDLVLTTLCAAAVFALWRANRPGLCDLAALLLFGLVLGGIALIGQVYQLQSEPWHALVLWLALCTPFLAFTALTRLTGMIWALAVVTTWFAAEEPVSRLLVRLGVMHGPEGTSTFLPVLAYLPACGMIVVAILRGLWPPGRRQADLLLRLAFAGLILQCSVVMVLRLPVGGDNQTVGPICAVALVTLLAALGCWLGYRRPGRLRLIGLLATCLVAWTLAARIADSTSNAIDVERAILFIVYWAVLGAMAARGGWRGLFGLSFTLIGLRLLMLYFEAIGGLTATGLGLLGGGVICLILAAVGWQLTRKIGPRNPAAASGAPA